MKFKTLQRLILFFMAVSFVTTIISIVVVMYGYHALLEYVGNPFAMIFSGAIAIMLTTVILYITGNTLINAYKDSRRNRK